jgi:hypothetical protein
MLIVGSVLLAMGVMSAGGNSSPAAGSEPEPVPAVVAEWFENAALSEARQLQASTVTVDGVTAGTILPKGDISVRDPRAVEGWRQASSLGQRRMPRWESTNGWPPCSRMETRSP